MKQPIIVTLALCPYCHKEFRSRDKIRVLDTYYKHLRKMHSKAERSFREEVETQVKLLKGGHQS